MNSGFINGFSVNGAAYPSWVIRAVAVAACVVSVTAVPNRVVFASAAGDASVSVHLTQTHTVQSKGVATAGAVSSANPTFKYAGACIGVATVRGNAAVRRDVVASAGGDSTCTAEALTAQAIGEATATSASSVELANAHIVFPGWALTPCVATGTGTGDVTRYPTVLAGYGEIVFTRGEASVKRNGTSFYARDGYVLNATAGATCEVPQDRVKIIATLGSFDYCDSTGVAKPFVKHSCFSSVNGIATANQVIATHVRRADSYAQANSIATITPIRTVLPTASYTCTATAYALKALTNHAARSFVDAQVSASAPGVRTTMGDAIHKATSDVVGILNYGNQHRATASDSTTATGSASAKQRHAGRVNETASVLGGQAVGVRKSFGRVDTTMATALVGRAYALVNSEIKAPDDRYMTVPAEVRVMYVAAEDRTMVVTA